MQTSITFNVPTIVTAGVVTLLVALVILGGIKRISSVSEKVVPLMAGLYILGVLIVIAFNLDEVPHAVSIIIESAFNPKVAFRRSCRS